MEKVLNITARLEDRRRKEQVEAYRDKFEAVQRVLQCSACHFRCAMCGRQTKGPDSSSPPQPALAESSLCESCLSEFEAFQKISKEGRSEADIFWHNDEWIELWACWLDYQRSIEKFRNSFDFNRLTEKSTD
ncbi:MAG: hypothetical protein ABIE47_09945 [Pseudomonadota bacterium]